MIINEKLKIIINAKTIEVKYVDRGSGDVRVEDVNLRGETIKQVSEFTYLGSVVTSDGKTTEDIGKRRAGARRAFG